MRLYPKKLRSLEDLEREKKLLLKEQKQLEKDDLLSLGGIFGKKGSEDGEGGSMFDLLSFLPISKSVSDVVIKLAKGWFAKKSEKPAPGPVHTDRKEKKGKSILRSVAVEFIGGYLKWKAIELSFKGIRHILRKRKENRTNNK